MIENLNISGPKKQLTLISSRYFIRMQEAGKKEAKLLNKLGLTLSQKFVGFGYRNYYAGFWVFLVTGLGFLVVQFSGQVEAPMILVDLIDRIFYSFDILLPIVKLNELHYDTTMVKICGWAKYYFYLHKLMGYFLASVLIAGLSGITKK